MGRPRGSKKPIAEKLIAIATKEEEVFSTTYQGLPLQKLQSLEKWSTWAKSTTLKYPEKRALTFLNDLEHCVSGELRFLLEISGKLTQRLYKGFNDEHIPPLQRYWNENDHPKELYKAYDSLKGATSSCGML